MEASGRWLEQALNLQQGRSMELAYNVLSDAFGLPPDHKHRIATLAHEAAYITAESMNVYGGRSRTDDARAGCFPRLQSEAPRGLQRAMNGKGVSVSTAGGKAYDFIRSSILSGDFSPGRRLKEEELTTLCEVSRTPVREALRRLALEGLVIVTPNAGAQVSAVSTSELAEIYALRAMIEGHAAERAAGLMDRVSLVRLRGLAVRMEQAGARRDEGFSADFTSANSEFHRIILDAAASPRLSSMSAFVIELPLARRTLEHYSHQDLDRSMGHHRELIDALEARDGAWAASVMKSHILAAHHVLTRKHPAGMISTIL